LFESVWSQIAKVMEEKENRKRKRREQKKEKGSHWADPGTGPAQ
jgi:hypothetical protein